MKHIFLVDFENVHIGGLKGIKSLTADDKIVIFFSENCGDTIEVIRELHEGFQYIKIVKNGQNALDFQLSSYLGFVINESIADETQFVIISKDNGFDCVIGFWKKNNIKKDLKSKLNIRRAISIESALASEKKEVQIKEEPLTLQQQEIDEIIMRFNELKDFHNYLVNNYKEIGLKIYKENKARHKQLHKS